MEAVSISEVAEREEHLVLGPLFPQQAAEVGPLEQVAEEAATQLEQTLWPEEDTGEGQPLVQPLAQAEALRTFVGEEPEEAVLTKGERMDIKMEIAPHQHQEEQAVAEGETVLFDLAEEVLADLERHFVQSPLEQQWQLLLAEGAMVEAMTRYGAATEPPESSCFICWARRNTYVRTYY